LLTEFEQQLANVLGARLPPPLTGRVHVAPGPASTNQIRLVLGVEGTELIEADFLAHRDLRLPGSPDFRRVVNLRCTVAVRTHTNQGRSGQLSALDAALFELDAPDFRDGAALAGGDDPGFLIQKTWLGGSSSPLDAEGDEPMRLTLLAEGWFWPVGLPAQEGRAIQEALVRAGLLPLQLLPADPGLVAGGPPLELTLRLGSAGTARLRAEEQPEVLAFGSLALTLRDAGAGPGAGTLSGGVTGAGDAQIVTLTDGEATVTYTPPAAAGVDFLVVALEDGEGGQGVELARFRIGVR
jgi:hypothetical protein